MDRNTNGGGIAFYVWEDLPSGQISFKSDDKDIEHFSVEMNLRKKKWIISCSYNPHLQFIDKHLTYIGKRLDSLSSKYYFILMGDLSADLSNVFVDSFCRSYGLKSPIKKPTCFKNPHRPKCKDLILTNRQKSFQNSTILGIRLSDFHKLTLAVLKSYFKKLKPKEQIVILRTSLTNSFEQNL